MKWRVPTEASFENVIFGVLDSPKVAVPVGTELGAQLAAVFQSADTGVKSQVASCAWVPRVPSHNPISSIRQRSHSIRDILPTALRKHVSRDRRGLPAPARAEIDHMWNYFLSMEDRKNNQFYKKFQLW